MKRTQQTLVVALLGFFTVCVCQSQEYALTPAWTLRHSGSYDVSDSTVVIARGDTVTTADARTGDTLYTWIAPYAVQGLCLPRHKRGVTLLRIEQRTDEKVVIISDHSDSGSLERADTIDVSTTGASVTTSGRIFTISQSGRYIVTEDGVLLDRKKRSASRICESRYRIGHIGFNRDETAMSILSGYVYSLLRGGSREERVSQWLALDSSMFSCQFRVQPMPDPFVLQFLPGTSELLVKGSTYDVCTMKEIRRFPMVLNGVVSITGLRTVGFERESNQYPRTDFCLVVTDIETGVRYVGADRVAVDPLYTGSMSFKMSPSADIVVYVNGSLQVCVVPKLPSETRISTKRLRQSWTENTCVVPQFLVVPITAAWRLEIEIDGKPLRNGVAYLPAGEHRAVVRAMDGMEARAVLDTILSVEELPTTAFTRWTGRMNGIHRAGISPSANLIVSASAYDVVADVHGDSLIYVQYPNDSWFRTDDAIFATDRLVVFSFQRYTVEYSAGQHVWWQEDWHHRIVDLETLNAQILSQSCTSQSGDGSVRYLRIADRRRGRVSLFQHTFWTGKGHLAEIVVGTPQPSGRSGCQRRFDRIDVDPSQDNPLCGPSSDGIGAWRRYGDVEQCGDTLPIPPRTMIFTNEGRHVWTDQGIYDGRTGGVVRSIKLPTNVMAVPHTSLVLSTTQRYVSQLDSTVFTVHHAESGDTAGQLLFRGRIVPIVFDTSGNLLFVRNDTDSVLHMLDMLSILTAAGCDTFRVSTPSWPGVSSDDTPHDEQSQAHREGARSFPNPAVDMVELTFTDATFADKLLTIVDGFGATVYTSSIDPSMSHVMWDLRTSTGQRVAPGMYGFLIRATDGRVIESGSLIVAGE